MAMTPPFQGKGGYLGVLEATLGIWIENVFFAQRLWEKESKCLPLFPLQEICPLAARGLLHQAEQRAAPTMTQTDCLHVTASFAALCSNCGAAIYLKKPSSADWLSPPPPKFLQQNSFGGWNEERIYFPVHFKKYYANSLLFLYGQGTGLTISCSFGPPDELFQLRCLCHSSGGGSLSSEMLPAASWLHSQVWLCSSRSPVSREPITFLWGLLPAEGAEASAWDWR